jgi:hypothetical protein
MVPWMSTYRECRDIQSPFIHASQAPDATPTTRIQATNTARNTLLLPRTLPALENTPARSNTYSSSSQLARPARLPVLTARSQADPALETDVTETVLSF